MKKEYRLLKNHQFNEVFLNKKLVTNKEFFIYFKFRQDFDNIQVGICVPKKLVPRAFSRNKIKRQIREMIKDINKNWSINIVILIRSQFLKNDYNENLISFRKLLTKVPLKEER